jgi:hypothetical protein
MTFMLISQCAERQAAKLTQADTSARRRFLCNSFKQTSLSAGETLSQSHPDVSYAMSAWVIRVDSTVRRSLPVVLDKRTVSESVGMS